MSDLVSINEAVKRKWSRLRLDKWVNDLDHIEITIVDHAPGPWVKFWSPINVAVCQQENPQTLLITMLGHLDDPVWRRYVGPDGIPAQPTKELANG